MSARNFLWSKIALMVGLLVVCLSCAKKPDMDVSIYVKLRADTTKVVPGAKVVLSKRNVEVIGYTDNNGRFKHTFKLEMILDVVATKITDTTTFPLTGRTVISLNEKSKDYRKTVFIN